MLLIAAPSFAAAIPGDVAVWSDSFESYPVGSTASSGGWEKGLGGQPTVSSERGEGSAQSFKFTSYPYNAPSAHRLIAAPPLSSAFVEASVWFDAPPGMGDANIGFMTNEGTSSRWLTNVDLSPNGELRLAIDNVLGGIVLGRWSPNTWIRIRIAVVIPTPALLGSIAVCVDGAPVYESPVAYRSDFPWSQLSQVAVGDHAEPTIPEVHAWFDNVRGGTLDGGAATGCGGAPAPVPDLGLATIAGRDSLLARAYASAVWDGSVAYLFGGRGPGDVLLSDIVAYDPAAGVATRMGAHLTVAGVVRGLDETVAVWDPRDRPAAGCTGGCAYIFGGRFAFDRSYSDNILRYNPWADTLVTMSGRLPTGRVAPAAAWDGAKAYVIGGCCGDVDGYHDRGFRDVLAYDPVADASPVVLPGQVPVRVPGQQGAYDTPTAFASGGSLFVSGGSTRGESVPYGVTRYDLAAQQVSTMAVALPARNWVSVAWDGRYAYYFGGCVNNPCVPDPVLGILRYDPAADALSYRADLPTARYGAAAVWTGDAAFVFGGYDGTYLDEAVRFLPMSPSPPGEGLPGAPANVRVTALPGTGSLRVAWDPPVEGGPVLSYRVYRGSSPGSEQLIAETSDRRSYIDAGLPAGARFDYQVSAVNSEGEGPRSTHVIAVVHGVPAAPRLLAALPPTARGEVRLAWSPPADDGGMPISAYRVERGPPGFEAPIAVVEDLAFTDTGLPDGFASSYVVRAVNAAGTGLPSNALVTSTIGPPAAPQGLAATRGPGPGQLRLHWEAPEDDGGAAVTAYEVHRDGNLIAMLAGSARSFQDGSLAVGSHLYEVAAVNDVGPGAQAGLVASPPLPPGPPENLTALLGPRLLEVALHWSAPGDDGGLPVRSYRIYRGSSPDDVGFLAEVSGSREYTDRQVTPWETYYYRAAATNLVGEGPWSREVAGGAGDASACRAGPACVALSLGGPSRGTVAVATDGDAEDQAMCAGLVCTPGGVAASGTGASRGFVALSGTGSADGPVALSAGTCHGSRCVAVEPFSEAEGGDAAVSGTGPARGPVAVSVAGDASCSPTTSPCAAASGAGDSQGRLAASALGDAAACADVASCVAASGAGNASGWVAASLLGNATGRVTAGGWPLLAALPALPPVPVMTPCDLLAAFCGQGPVGLNTTGPSAGSLAAAGLAGDAHGSVVAVSVLRTAVADGGLCVMPPVIIAFQVCEGVAVSGTGGSRGDDVALSGTGGSQSGGLGLAASAVGDAGGGLVSASGLGSATGFFAASGAGEGHGRLLGASATRDAKADSGCVVYCTAVAVSGTGNASSSGVAVSGTGSANGGCVTVYGGVCVPAGIAVSCLPACRPEGRAVAVNPTGDAQGDYVAVSGTGNATSTRGCVLGDTGCNSGYLALSGTGEAKGGLVHASGCDRAPSCPRPP